MNAREEESRKGHAMEQDDPPPFLGSWKRVYVSIMAYTCALILLLYFMTAALNR